MGLLSDGKECIQCGLTTKGMRNCPYCNSKVCKDCRPHHVQVHKSNGDKKIPKETGFLTQQPVVPLTPKNQMLALA